MRQPNSSTLKKLTLVLATAAFAVTAQSCFLGCSVAPLETSPDGGAAYVDDAGTVVFNQIFVGDTEHFQVPLRDSNTDADETLESASLSGPNAEAFKVLSTFPMELPPGQTVYVDVAFAPQATGDASATLAIQTKMMGVAPVQLTGSAQ
jgi:hypothetical protein